MAQAPRRLGLQEVEGPQGNRAPRRWGLQKVEPLEIGISGGRVANDMALRRLDLQKVWFPEDRTPRKFCTQRTGFSEDRAFWRPLRKVGFQNSRQKRHLYCLFSNTGWQAEDARKQDSKEAPLHTAPQTFVPVYMHVTPCVYTQVYTGMHVKGRQDGSHGSVPAVLRKPGGGDEPGAWFEPSC